MVTSLKETTALNKMHDDKFQFVELILSAHFYTTRMCVLRYCVPNKGLHPLRRFAAILA